MAQTGSESIETQRRQREIEFLCQLRRIFANIKQELNNDLTKLAIKNLPIMMETDGEQQQTFEVEISEVNLSQSTQESSKDDDGAHQMQQLEPLDLDI